MAKKRRSTPGEGVAIGIGLAAAGAIAWSLPTLAAREGWRSASQFAAWLLFSVGAGVAFNELGYLTQRDGYGDIGAAAFLASLAAGGFRVGRGMDGPLATTVLLGATIAALLGVVGLAVGLAKALSPRDTAPSKTQPKSPVAETGSRRTLEVLSVTLAAGQLVAAILALL